MQNRLFKAQEDFRLENSSIDSQNSSFNTEVFNNSASKLFFPKPDSPVISARALPKSDFFSGFKTIPVNTPSKLASSARVESISRGQSKKNLGQTGDSKKEVTSSMRSNSKALKEIKPKPKKVKVPLGLNLSEHQLLMKKLESILTKQDGPQRLKEIVRRKSCSCTCCGGKSHKEEKFDYIFAKKQAKVEKKEEKEEEQKIPVARRKKIQHLQTMIDTKNSLDSEVNEKGKTVVLRPQDALEKRQGSKKALVNPTKFAPSVQNENNSETKSSKFVSQKPETEAVKTPNEEKTPAKMPPISTAHNTPARVSTTSSPKGSTSKNTDASWKKFRTKITQFSTTKHQTVVPHSSRLGSSDKLLTHFDEAVSSMASPKSSRVQLTKLKPVESPYIEYSNAIKDKKVIPRAPTLLKTYSVKAFQCSPLSSPRNFIRKIQLGPVNEHFSPDTILPVSTKASMLTSRDQEKIESDPAVNKLKSGKFKNYESFHLPKVKKLTLQTEPSMGDSQEISRAVISRKHAATPRDDRGLGMLALRKGTDPGIMTKSIK